MKEKTKSNRNETKRTDRLTGQLLLRKQVKKKVNGDSEVAGMLGNVNCDSPLALLESALQAAKGLQPDLLVWTGDTLSHHQARLTQIASSLSYEQGQERFRLSREAALWTFKNATDAISRILPGVPVFPALGNHDFYPANTDPGPEGKTRQWLTSALANDIWSKWLSEDEAKRTFAWGGFYRMPLQTYGGSGSRPEPETTYVIGLNTEVCHMKNYYAFSDETNASEQLAWLRASLMELDRMGGRAIIIGHIPPGLWSGCWGEYSEEYEQVVSDFEDVILAQFYGHDHSGSFRIFYGGDDLGDEVDGNDGNDGNSTSPAPVSVAHVTPSLTPFKDQYPSFRVYEVVVDAAGAESQSGVIGFTQYFLDLAKYAGIPGNDEVVAWFVSFRAPKSLGLANLSPESWKFVADKLLSNTTIRDDFVKLWANGRPFMGTKGLLRTYACGARHVKIKDLIECSKQNEEQFIRDYTGNQHTYVLTTMFSFDVLFAQFCNAMNGFLPEDCKIYQDAVL